MKKVILNFSISILLIGATITNSHCQITTSGLKGRIVNEKNETLPGASIVALHLPSGTQYGVLANEDGRFSINNMRVGGPYQVTVSFVGYNQQVYNDINLSLGNVTDLTIGLSPSVTSLNEVIVSAGRSSIINSERTGAAINLSNETVNSIPTISRGLKDFTKISPLANTAGSGTSFSGSNNRYNQFSIDGLVNNDVFGLTSSGTNGGQAGIEPISLDAIEEFQINIAPYDIRQGGFTGGGINAVTKSGTNKFQGSVYFYGNNENFVGRFDATVDSVRAYSDYYDYQSGFTIGGPIIKNKLFFFLNGEIARNVSPLSSVPGTAASKITLDEVNRVLAVLDRVAPSYDPGGNLDISDEIKSNKILAKLNWNISDKHKLTLRHSYTYGENIDNSRSPTALRFYNNGQYFPTTTNSTGLELHSIFNSKMSNRLMLGYTRVRDDREPLGAAFPQVTINIDNLSGKTITFGSEYSSVANQLDQDIYSLTNDFSLFLGKHTFTFGTHNELYSFYNLFVQNIYGNYAYNTLANFETVGTALEVSPTYYGIGYSFDNTDNPLQSKGGAEFYAMQLGLYAQDELQLTNNLQVTGGLRIDVPVFPQKPEANAIFNTDYASSGVATGVLPGTRVMWSPRVGFNWDVLGNKTLQVRGGSGLFTGRVPFVWISNQFSNTGLLNGTYTNGGSSASSTPITSPAGITFIADPYNQKLAEDFGLTASKGAINVVDNKLKFPQVFRSNLATDFKLPWDIFATIEGIFSKTYNNVNFINLNRDIIDNFSFIGTDQRPRYTARSNSPTSSGYNSSARINSTYDEIIKFENTNKGYAYDLVFMLQKQFTKGFKAQISYTYGDSKDLNSGTSSVAYSNWRYTSNVNGLNDLELSRSNYSMGSRVTGLISYKIEYLRGKMATQISLYYNGQSGQPMSYIYNGDMNNDGTDNDLIYIPKSSTDINLVAITGSNPVTVADQWTALDEFIKNDKYLSRHRGEFAGRNGARLAFQHQFDVRILQDLKVDLRNSSNKLQLSLDIINIGNMINENWGHQYYASNQQFKLINFTGLTDTDPTAGYNYSNQPKFTFTGGSGRAIDGGAYSISDLASRWRMQFGIRYVFN